MLGANFSYYFTTLALIYRTFQLNFGSWPIRITRKVPLESPSPQPLRLSGEILREPLWAVRQPGVGRERRGKRKVSTSPVSPGFPPGCPSGSAYSVKCGVCPVGFHVGIRPEVKKEQEIWIPNILELSWKKIPSRSWHSWPEMMYSFSQRMAWEYYLAGLQIVNKLLICGYFRLAYLIVMSLICSGIGRLAWSLH